MRLIFSLILCCFLISDTLTAQTDFQAIEKELMVWSKTVITDSLLENRVASSTKIEETLNRILKAEDSFAYPFDSIKHISIQYPIDSTFRIFTWQLYKDINEYKYFGFIQLKGDQPQVIELTDRASKSEDLDFETLTPENWYGAVYYNILSFEKEGKSHYLLFGFDGYQFFNKRKIIDVLTIDNGNAQFGAAVFSPLDKNRIDLIKNRQIIQYSSEAVIVLNYNTDLEMIVFSHLLSVNGPGGPTKVPDGSYHGYKFEDGLWTFVDKIFDQISEEAPRPKPILDTRKKKDILGN